jgi:hypothetical protein
MDLGREVVQAFVGGGVLLAIIRPDPIPRGKHSNWQQRRAARFISGRIMADRGSVGG